MSSLLPSLCVLLLAVPPRAETHFVQVAPVQREVDKWERSPKQERAVVLIHGLRLFFKKESVLHPEFRDWQEPNSPLVKRFGQEADVYACAYSQNVAADEIGEVPEFGEHIQRIKKLGYKEIVVVGYSAGGLIARRYVEDFPDGGVTKVIQVCAPNGGSGWAKIKAVRAIQLDFIGSLTKEKRLQLMRERVNKVIPANIQFVCVVGAGIVIGDGFVSCKSQWTDDLQEQGIPAVAVSDTHRHIMHSKKSIEILADLVRNPQPRWEAKQVLKVRREILGN